jgi:hypothetical protein
MASSAPQPPSSERSSLEALTFIDRNTRRGPLDETQTRDACPDAGLGSELASASVQAGGGVHAGGCAAGRDLG